MARKRKKKDNGGLSGDEWLTTYSDTVTLLLTFFILLYTTSIVDTQKLKGIAKEFQSMFSSSSGNAVFQVTENAQLPTDGDSEGQGSKDVFDVYEQVKEFIEEKDLNAELQIKEDERGVILQIKDSILFESGKAELKDNSLPMLSTISELMGTLPNNIIVEGHTDNVPINNYIFKSNWELSTTRAVNVVKFFIENKGQNPVRFTAAGYGEFKPIVANDSDENKAKNRRVNILLVVPEKEDKK
ncbi:flagellar motor protein MotB [Clostridium frigidicarnis]|uniref:Chemotaxis protein MotB n=1 Tax=Clostridium frigidicarnis TaxID=84698 RepID=A0A1I0VEU5_9CLOT|nr:flagellar motor protein MotB [Clostridium frigidicarnis]SFA74812.1 chemotaxis protein MotB [Clostridium frigidicarnis]